MKCIALFLCMCIFLSCKDGKKETTISEHQNMNKPKRAIIDFDLNKFSKIKDYKEIDFNSSAYSYDKYLLSTDSITYNNCYKNMPEFKDIDQLPNSFTLPTKYANVRFSSVEENETYLKYQHLSELKGTNYEIVRAWTIDSPSTIFLNKEKHEGFLTSGIIAMSHDKQYIVSFSNEPEYCILEIYKIENKTISNVINLYSVTSPIDNLCWGSQLSFKTVLMKEKRNYFILDFKKITADFEKKK
jgi:hypothetical protein